MLCSFYALYKMVMSRRNADISQQNEKHQLITGCPGVGEEIKKLSLF